MWLLVAREPRQDAAHWPGRKSLAALDAVAWPLAAVLFLLIQAAHLPLGIFGPVLIAGALLLSAARLRRAIWLNSRYHFTAWRWGVGVLGLLMVGTILKLVS